MDIIGDIYITFKGNRVEERNLYSLAGCCVRDEENYTFLCHSDDKHLNMPPCGSPALLIVE